MLTNPLNPDWHVGQQQTRTISFHEYLTLGQAEPAPTPPVAAVTAPEPEPMPKPAPDPTPAKKAKKAKPLSRAARWAEAVGVAQTAIQKLLDIQYEYQEWYDQLPENLQSSPTGERLESVCDLDIDGAFGTLEEADGVDLPRGFGRD
jgi:hypothetical protein